MLSNRCVGMQALYLVIAFLTYSNGYNSTDPNELETNETTKKVNCSDPNERLNLQCIDNTLDGKLLHLFLFTSLSGLWVIYITFYNSRFVGLILSKIINQVYKGTDINYLCVKLVTLLSFNISCQTG